MKKILIVLSLLLSSCVSAYGGGYSYPYIQDIPRYSDNVTITFTPDEKRILGIK